MGTSLHVTVRKSAWDAMSRLGSVGPPWDDVSNVVLMLSMLIMLCRDGRGVVGPGVPELPEIGLVYSG